MPDESRNNGDHWLKKLDNLEQPPGGLFNKEASWGRLYNRMAGEKTGKHNRWYWIAAACLLFISVIALINFHKVSPNSSLKQTVIGGAKKQDKPALTKVNGAQISVGVKEIVKTKENVVIPSAQLAQPRHRRRVLAVSSTAQLNSSAGLKLPDAEIKVPGPVNIGAAVASALPVKKKLEVVHINELGDPLGETPDFVHNIRNHKFKLANEEVYVNPSGNDKTKDLTILSTKL